MERTLALPPIERTAKVVEEVDVIVLGHIAAVYAQAGGNLQAMPGWGSALPGIRQDPILDRNGTRWYASTAVRDYMDKPTMGVLLVKHTKATANGKKIEQMWFPLASLAAMKFSIVGARLETLGE